MQHGGSNDYCALIACLAMLAPFWVTARGSRGPSHVLMPAADYRLRARMPYPIRDYAIRGMPRPVGGAAIHTKKGAVALGR
jgi:hypothetical protein